MTGIDEFKRLLKEFKNLSLWIGGASLVAPFIASSLAIIPPWPHGVAAITSALQLVTLIVAYQGFSGDSNSVTKNVRRLGLATIVVLLIYVIVFTMFTIYVPQAGRALVIGFECSTKAKIVYGPDCPLLSLQALSSVAYDEFELWTKLSISLMRALILFLWLGLFFTLSLLVGQFLVFQMRRRANVDKPSTKSRR